MTTSDNQIATGNGELKDISDESWLVFVSFARFRLITVPCVTARGHWPRHGRAGATRIQSKIENCDLRRPLTACWNILETTTGGAAPTGRANLNAIGFSQSWQRRLI